MNELDQLKLVTRCIRLCERIRHEVNTVFVTMDGVHDGHLRNFVADCASFLASSLEELTKELKRE